jgi:tetratricopeptide (TPR) repeat protein
MCEVVNRCRSGVCCLILISLVGPAVLARAPLTQPPADESIAALMVALENLVRDMEREFPDRDEPAVLRGLLHRQQGDHARAERVWQEVLRKNPDQPEALSHLGMTALEREQYAKAVRYWRRAIAADPGRPGLRQDLGFALLESGRTSEAIEALLQELMLTPRSSRALDLLGQCYLQTQAHQKARDAFLRALRCDPQNAAAHYGLMTVAQRLQEADRAAEHRARFRALTQDPPALLRGGHSAEQDRAEVRAEAADLILQAYTFYRLQDGAERAAALLDWAHRLAPRPVSIYLKRQAVAHQRKDMPDAALAMAADLARLEPDRADNHLGLGMLALKTARLDQARAAFERTVALAPQLPEGHRELARVYTLLGIQPQAALARARQAVNLAGSAEDYYVLSGAHLALQQIPEARAAMREAHERSPDNPVYRQGYEFLQNRSAR